MNSPIEFSNVHRNFGNQDVLQGLTFSVDQGCIYALLGRNGSGKTTAIRILLGLLRPMRGRTAILGKDSLLLEPADRGRIGYVAEGHRLYSTMRVKEALEFEAGTRTRFDRSCAERAIARCGLPLNKYIGRLSRGQRAQLSLVFAAASKPEVLIFDDPAMGLDVVMRREFLDAMIDLLSDRGCAVLFSSHILTDVERIADRIGILQGGRHIVDAGMADLKRRVQKRRWFPKEGTPPNPPGAEWILKTRAAKEGFDLTLLDMDPAREAFLRKGARLSEPEVPTLEDLFMDLTTEGESLGLFTSTGDA